MVLVRAGCQHISQSADDLLGIAPVRVEVWVVNGHVHAQEPARFSQWSHKPSGFLPVQTMQSGESGLGTLIRFSLGFCQRLELGANLAHRPKLCMVART